MEQVLGLGVVVGLPGMCFELMVPVLCYSFAFPKAGHELNQEKPLASFSQGKWGLDRGQAFPTG